VEGRLGHPDRLQLGRLCLGLGCPTGTAWTDFGNSNGIVVHYSKTGTTWVT
jgi:hypothetical protein